MQQNCMMTCDENPDEESWPLSSCCVIRTRSHNKSSRHKIAVDYTMTKNPKKETQSKEQALDLQGLETFGRHLLHDDEYPPDHVTLRDSHSNEERETRNPSATMQTQDPSAAARTTAVVHGESQQEALEHFASHLIHNSEARLEMDESTKKA